MEVTLCFFLPLSMIFTFSLACLRGIINLNTERGSIDFIAQHNFLVGCLFFLAFFSIMFHCTLSSAYNILCIYSGKNSRLYFFLYMCVLN